jgi:hypothetical protein
MLFVPEFTRGGFMHHGEMREQIGLAVRRAVLWGSIAVRATEAAE